MKVQVLYDFDGEPGSSELTVRAGEVLTVTRQDVGEGWWEGLNQHGQTGLFPAAYVEAVENADYWDDEWDDDSDGGGSTFPSSMECPTGKLPPPPKSIDDNGLVGGRNQRGTRPRPVVKSSSFAKSGNDYINGTLHLTVPDNERVFIVDNEYGAVWSPVTTPYQCAVASPKKESKLKGLKSFIAYQLTPSFNNIQVSRRYKHFDWLHERLQEKFSLIPVPPLPDKQIAGRYEEQFIEHRKNQLQAFVDSVCRHPVLSRCAVWQHFVTCTDEKKWKAGKRKAEKDEFIGANFFFTVIAPERPLSIITVEQEVESFSRYIHGLDMSAKNLSNVVADETKKWQSLYKREYQRIGYSFTSFGQSYGLEDQHTGYSRVKLTEAIKQTGEVYSEIGKLFEEQSKLDWEPLGDVLHIFKGIIASFPDILNLHKGAIQKRKESERMTAEGKLDADQLQETIRRTDVVSYSLMAEINHFHTEQASELNQIFKSFIVHQIIFHQKVICYLQDVLKMYE